MNEKTNGYIGSDRRDDDGNRNQSPMSLVVTGARLPFLTVVALMGSIFMALASGAIWLTKLDDRTLQTALQTQDNSSALREHFKLIREVEKNLTVNTGILTALSEKVDDISVTQTEHIKEDRVWRQRIIANEEADKSHHSHELHEHNYIPYPNPRSDSGLP